MRLHRKGRPRTEGHSCTLKGGREVRRLEVADHPSCRSNSKTQSQHRRLPVNLVSLVNGWSQSADEGCYCGFQLQQIFATEGAFLGRTHERTRSRCPDDWELSFAIHFASNFCKADRLILLGFALVTEV